MRKDKKAIFLNFHMNINLIGKEQFIDLAIILIIIKLFRLDIY